MHLRLFTTILTILLFGVMATAQDKLKISFEPVKYPVTRDDLLNVKAINRSDQAIEANILFEVKTPSDKVLYSWSVPNYLIPPGTQTIQMKGVSDMSFTSDNINSAQDQNQLAIFVTATIASQYGYSEKTTIYRFPAQSFDFNSQFSDHSNTTAAKPTDSTTIKSESEIPPSSPTPASPVEVTTTVPNQITDYTRPDKSATTTVMTNDFMIVPEKMNVLYLGVDNPLRITGADNITTVSCNQPGIGIRPIDGALFVVTVNIPGEYTLTISSANGEHQQVFRAKRIPDPVAFLGDTFGGNIGADQFIEQSGVILALHRFDFDAECQATGYTVWRIQQNGIRSSIINRSPLFSAETKQLISQAVPGDIYLFDNIRARCSGDVVNRAIHGMTFFIK